VSESNQRKKRADEAEASAARLSNPNPNPNPNPNTNSDLNPNPPCTLTPARLSVCVKQMRNELQDKETEIFELKGHLASNKRQGKEEFDRVMNMALAHQERLLTLTLTLTLIMAGTLNLALRYAITLLLTLVYQERLKETEFARSALESYIKEMA